MVLIGSAPRANSRQVSAPRRRVRLGAECAARSRNDQVPLEPTDLVAVRQWARPQMAGAAQAPNRRHRLPVLRRAEGLGYEFTGGARSCAGPGARSKVERLSRTERDHVWFRTARVVALPARTGSCLADPRVRPGEEWPRLPFLRRQSSVGDQLPRVDRSKPCERVGREAERQAHSARRHTRLRPQNLVEMRQRSSPLVADNHRQQAFGKRLPVLLQPESVPGQISGGSLTEDRGVVASDPQPRAHPARRFARLEQARLVAVWRRA
jgi:hypothetical protein